MIEEATYGPSTRTPCRCGRPRLPRKMSCSVECERAYRAAHKAVPVPVLCESCGKSFMALKDRRSVRRYCSAKCCGDHAVATGKFSGQNNPRWLGGVSADNMRYRRRTIAKHPLPEAARRAVHEAVRAGRLERQPCERCGATKTEGHHDDYGQALKVRWLCRRHHVDVHNELRSAGRDPDEGAPSLGTDLGTGAPDP